MARAAARRAAGAAADGGPRAKAAAKERAALFAELAAAKNEAEARAIEDKIWKFWLQFRRRANRGACSRTREQAQLRFDYGEALIDAERAGHACSRNFAEGWNQLAYVLFLRRQLRRLA